MTYNKQKKGSGRKDLRPSTKIGIAPYRGLWLNTVDFLSCAQYLALTSATLYPAHPTDLLLTLTPIQHLPK